MALLRHVCKVDTKTIHMALVPFMLLGAVNTRVVTECCAETFITRYGASRRGITVRRWLEAMLVENVQDVVVCAMVQFLLSRFLQVFGGQVLPVLLMASRQCVIPDGIDANDSGVAGVKRC